MYDSVRAFLDGRLLTPDLAGFGSAPLSRSAPSLDVYADSVASLLDAEGVDQVVLGGTSMGGYTAMAFCRRHRERVAGLALVDTKASADAPEAAAGRRAMADTMESGATTAPLLEQVLPKLLGTSTVTGRPELVQSVTSTVAAADPRAAAWAQRAMAGRPDSSDVLRSLTVPALVVVGAEDVLTPPADADAMVADLRDVDIEVVDAAGHLTPLEAPDRVAAALHRLMERVTA